MLTMMLPLMIGILMVIGGVAPATDLVAAEKERNTFEPLLTTKPERHSILIGKYLAVTLFSFINLIASLVGIIIGYKLNPNFLTMGTGDQIVGFSIPPLAIILGILISCTLGATFAGLQVALSTYARSFKEAQIYMSFLIIVAMLPGYSIMYMQPTEIPVYMFAIPVLNTIAAFKMVLGCDTVF